MSIIFLFFAWHFIFQKRYIYEVAITSSGIIYTTSFCGRDWQVSSTHFFYQQSIWSIYCIVNSSNVLLTSIWICYNYLCLLNRANPNTHKRSKFFLASFLLFILLYILGNMECFKILLLFNCPTIIYPTLISKARSVHKFLIINHDCWAATIQ